MWRSFDAIGLQGAAIRQTLSTIEANRSPWVTHDDLYVTGGASNAEFEVYHYLTASNSFLGTFLQREEKSA